MIEPKANVGYLDNDQPPEEESKKEELGLVIWPDKFLKQSVFAFPEIDLGTRKVKDLAGAMIKTMYKYHGMGLAAQQVGIPFAIFVMDTTWFQPDQSKKPRVFLNPLITAFGEGIIQVDPPGEGCLSFPYDYRQPVKRADKVELEWLDFKGNVHQEWFEGHEAITVQHEMDHLGGFCFIDRLSKLKRDMAIAKARKIRKQYLKGHKTMIRNLKHAPRTKEYQLKRAAAFDAGVRAGKET